MSFLTGWLMVLLIGSIAVISPGPDFVLTLRSSLTYSRRAGLYTAFGIGVGNLVHVTYSLIGIGAIISQSILLFNILKWIGAAYLVYIGIKSLGAKKQPQSLTDLHRTKTISRWMAFRIGLLGNLLNPKATLFFLALFTQIIQPETPIGVRAIYGATVATLALIWFASVAVLISQPGVKRLFQSVSHWVERLTGAVLIILGVRLAIAKAHD